MHHGHQHLHLLLGVKLWILKFRGTRSGLEGCRAVYRVILIVYRYLLLLKCTCRPRRLLLIISSRQSFTREGNLLLCLFTPTLHTPTTPCSIFRSLGVRLLEDGWLRQGGMGFGLCWDCTGGCSNILSQRSLIMNRSEIIIGHAIMTAYLFITLLSFISQNKCFSAIYFTLFLLLKIIITLKASILRLVIWLSVTKRCTLKWCSTIHLL